MRSEEKYIVLIFVFAFVVAIGNQAFTKVKLKNQYQKSKKLFKRHSGENVEMLSADRVVMNLVEWSGVWWPIFFANVLSAKDDTHITAGYVYVAARLGYVLIGTQMIFPVHGIVSKTPLMYTTVPAYLALTYLCYNLL